MGQRTSLHGVPSRRPSSSVTWIMVDPSGGIDSTRAPTNLPEGINSNYGAYSIGGESIAISNCIAREGGLEPRPRLQQVLTNSNPMGTVITGGMQVESSVGTYYPIISGTTRLAFYSAASWSVLSRVSANGYGGAPSGLTTDYWDMAQIYDPIPDDMIAVLANNSQDTLYCWQSGATIFSVLTGAPRAKVICTYDNFVLAANVRDQASAQSHYVQRIQWSDRGNPRSWTTGLSGFQDLLAASGEINRIHPNGNRIIVYMDREIWQGVRASYPDIFTFTQLDSTVGTAFPWTVSDTPLGHMFLGFDYMPYLLPKDGGSAQPIGPKVHRLLRGTLNHPETAWSLYDPNTTSWQLYYTTSLGPGRLALWYNVATGAWTQQDFLTRYLSRGFLAYSQTATSGLSWGASSLSKTQWQTAANAWQNYNATSAFGNIAVFAGSSSGTMYQFDSTASLDDGTVITGSWSPAQLGGHDIEHQKVLTEVRLEGVVSVANSIFTMTYAGGSSGRTFSTAGNQNQVVYHVNPVALYPNVSFTLPDIGWRLYRVQAKMRTGGRP